MTTRFGRTRRIVHLYALVWTAWLVLGIALCVLRCVRQLKLRGRRNLFQAGGALIVSNHRSIRETGVLPCSTFPEGLINFRLVPWSAPDKTNFTDHWFWRLAMPRLIPVPRAGTGRERHRAVQRMAAVVRSGGSLILHPEGGRTSSRKKQELRRLCSPRRHRHLRRLKSAAIGRILAAAPNAVVIPVWVETRHDRRRNIHGRPDWWRKMTIIVGAPMRFKVDTPAEEVAQCIEQALLTLADEV